MNDKERMETVREMLKIVVGKNNLHYYIGSPEYSMVEALKKFEAKVRDDEDLSIQDPVLFPYEDEDET